MASAPPKTTPAHDPWLDRYADPDSLPDAYAAPCRGQCMDPEIPDGTLMVFDRRQKPLPGDLVGIWFRPGQVPPGEPGRMLKRLVYDTDAGFLSSRGGSAIVVEMLNPPKRIVIDAARIHTLHRCVGQAIVDEDGRTSIHKGALQCQ